MKKRILLSIALLAAIGSLTWYLALNRGRNVTTAASTPAPVPEETLVAAPGRVEPASEEIKIGSEISGTLKEVLVDEGDPVSAGQVIASLDNGDYRARVASAEASLAESEADLRKTVNGARHQERDEAAASVKEAEAVMENARAEMNRRQALYRSGDIAREEAERAEKEFNVARARYEASSQRHSLVDDRAREEDRARAAAQVQLARARLDEARALLAKTIIRSPISGVVLRRHMRAGERIADRSDAPIFTLADMSTMRVRVDVDEDDVDKVRIGQQAYFTADAYGDRHFTGRIIRIGQLLGRKNIRTDEPAERVDKKILETLVELDPGSELPAGMRVNSFIVVPGRPQEAASAGPAR